MSSLSVLHDDLLQQIFDKCPYETLFLTIPKVCRRWRDHMNRNLFHFNSRMTQMFPKAGDDEEMEAIFHQLTKNGTKTHLRSLELFISGSFSWRTMYRLLDYATPDYSPYLTSLTVNFPFILKLKDFSHLKNLVIDMSDFGASFRLFSHVGSMVGGLPFTGLTGRHYHDEISPYTPAWGAKWCFPTSLESLSIIAYKNTVCDTLRIHLGSNEPLLNLKKLSIRASSKALHDDMFQLEKLAPSLLEFDFEGEDLRHRPRFSYPPTLVKLRLMLNHSLQNDFDVFPTQLPNLLDLSVLHQRRYVETDYWWEPRKNDFKPWPLEPLLSIPTLTHLHVASADIIKWQEEHDIFVVKLSTLNPKPPLEMINVQNLSISSIVALDRLRTAYPTAEIVGKITHLEKPLDRKSWSPHYEPYVGREVSEFYNPHSVVNSRPSGQMAPCQYCQISVDSMMMEDHYVICSEVARPCLLKGLGCHWRGRVVDLRAHLKLCPRYYVNCLDCRCDIHLTHYHEHTLHHEISNSRVPAQCLSLPSWSTPAWMLTICVYCRETFPTRKSARQHKCTAEKFELPIRIDSALETWIEKRKKRRGRLESTYAFSYADHVGDDHESDGTVDTDDHFD